MSFPMLCAPVQSGVAAPSIPQVVQGGPPVRSLSPLSVDEQQPVKKQPAAAPTAGASNPVRTRRMTLRFLCKARGVLDNHNAHNAYLDVPPDAGHGAILVCSHPACRNSGRKFRWCEVCRVPVAKRNFGKRHAHALLQTPRPPPILEAAEVLKDDASSSQSLKRQRLNSIGNFGETLPRTDSELVKKESTTVPKTVLVEPAPSVTNTIVSIGSTETLPCELSEKERQWLELFRKRPRDSCNQDDLRSWMEAVVDTAEIKSTSMSSQDEVTETRDASNTGEEGDDASIWDMQDLLLFADDDDILGDWARGL